MEKHHATAQEYISLLRQLGLSQAQTADLFDFSTRTSRRYKRGEVKVPPSVLRLLRMLANRQINKRQIEQS